MKKRTLFAGLYVAAIYAIVLTSCTQAFKDRMAENNANAKKFKAEHRSVHSVTLLTLEGDTVVITGGTVCHIAIKK